MNDQKGWNFDMNITLTGILIWQWFFWRGQIVDVWMGMKGPSNWKIFHNTWTHKMMLSRILLHRIKVHCRLWGFWGMEWSYQKESLWHLLLKQIISLLTISQSKSDKFAFYLWFILISFRFIGYFWNEMKIESCMGDTEWGYMDFRFGGQRSCT